MDFLVEDAVLYHPPSNIELLEGDLSHLFRICQCKLPLPSPDCTT